METKPTSLGGFLSPDAAKGALSVTNLGGKRDGGLILVGEDSQSKGTVYDVADELRFLKAASDLNLCASVSPLMLANYDFVLDAPFASPYFEKVAAAVMSTIAQDMGLVVASASVDMKMFRLTMRIRCIAWQVELLEHRYPDSRVTLVMDFPVTEDSATVEAAPASE